MLELIFSKEQLDGSLCLDPFLDNFHPIAERPPIFSARRRFTLEEDSILAPDGKTKHMIWRLTRDALLTPQDSTNASTHVTTIELLEVQCVAAEGKMHNPKHSQSACCHELYQHPSKCTAHAHADTFRSRATYDAFAFSVFGTYDNIFRRCPGKSMEEALGVERFDRSMMLSFGEHGARK